MASIVFRNSSRRLLRAYFSKLGWQANVIWRIAFFNQLQVYPSWLWRSDLFRASLNAAYAMLQRDISLPEAMQRLSREFDLSERQAYRYLEEAAHLDRPVDVCEITVPITLKLPAGTASLLRAYARRSG